MNHLDLVREAKTALGKVFYDRSVPRQQTRESLKEIRDGLDILLDVVTD